MVWIFLEDRKVLQVLRPDRRSDLIFHLQLRTPIAYLSFGLLTAYFAF